MRSRLYGALFVWMCCLALGMGTMGDSSSIKTPEPDKNFIVTLVDQDDVSMELEKFSYAGQTYLTGKLGKADLSIDFEKIRSILFVMVENQATAIVSLKGQAQVELTVENDTPCFGTSSFGDVRIDVRNIKKVILHGRKQLVE